MSIWLLLAVLGAISLTLRTAVLVAVDGRGLPAPVERVSRHLPTSMLVAMVAGGLWVASGAVGDARVAPETLLARLAALGVAAVVAHRTKAPGRTLLAGLATYTVVQVVAGL